ncbi:hypothetical protein FA95DRAFT_825625 [Auriscalpium vulgare]|uniref:Uncharacterized protein n=1 Tax=Auriscalpium vulgare TaxID=40419 RepID=A0ACB8R9Y4_9AGAM|nr:hypothetical protein FA95DRAFT_825625 [Auriscalpium vulgare]
MPTDKSLFTPLLPISPRNAAGSANLPSACSLAIFLLRCYADLQTFLLLVLWQFFFYAATSSSQQLMSPFVVPLAVRSPYLSYWHAIGPGTLLPDAGRPETSYPNTAGGWHGLVIVDGTTYVWLSDASVANQQAGVSVDMDLTPTRTIVTIRAGQVKLTATFLSPIEPGDWIRQSIPFSHVAVGARSLDGAPHSVQIYSAIGAQWATGNSSTSLIASAMSTSSSLILSSTVLYPVPYAEDATGLPQSGTVFYATKPGHSVTFEIGECNDILSMMQHSRALNNTVYNGTSNYVAGARPCLGLAHDLGIIATTPRSIFWVVGSYRDAAVQYDALSGNVQARNLYFNANSSLLAGNLSGLVDFVLNDYGDALARAVNLDERILGAANNVPATYADLLSIAARQAFGATELTIGKGSDGAWNQSDAMLFMKDIGATNPNRVNAVETLHASFPVFMVIDPTLGPPLLEPLLQFQSSSSYPNKYAAPDAGSIYPKVRGNDSHHHYGVEHTSSMLIMTCAHFRTSGDRSLVQRYYSVFKSWTDYLVANALYTDNQGSTDGGSGSNQTNLALKGVIAIQAMSIMSFAVNELRDATQYSEVATGLATRWANLALGSDKHMLATYGEESSWTLGYNLFADRWLRTELINPSIYEAQTELLIRLTTSAPDTFFGVSTDSTGVVAVSQCKCQRAPRLQVASAE